MGRVPGRLNVNSALDGAHTLTCALMLLNTDLHGHVSGVWREGAGKQALSKTSRPGRPRATQVHRPLFPPLEHREAHDLRRLHWELGGPQRRRRLPQGAAQGGGRGGAGNRELEGRGKGPVGGCRERPGEGPCLQSLGSFDSVGVPPLPPPPPPPASQTGSPEHAHWPCSPGCALREEGRRL